MTRLDPSGDGTASIGPSSFGLSSIVAGTPKAGERIIYPDDNSNHSPTTQIYAYNAPTPRTNCFCYLQTGHFNVWASTDAISGGGPGVNGNGIADNSDDQHPICVTFLTGTTSTGHISLGSGVNLDMFSATSHVQIYETLFMVPQLSDVTNQFRWRLGLINVVSGASAHGAYFELDSSANAQGTFVTAQSSTRTTVSTGISIVAGTWYRLRIVVTNNTAVDFYLSTESGALPSTPTQTITTNIPSGTSQLFQPFVGIEKLAGTSERDASITYIVYGRDRLAA